MRPLKLEMTGTEIVISSPAAQLTGAVKTEENNEMVKGATVLVYSIARKNWVPNSRFIITGQTDHEGRFSLNGIVPGEYFVAALVGHENGSEDDPAYLKEVQSLAKKIDLQVATIGREILTAMPAPAIR